MKQKHDTRYPSVPSTISSPPDTNQNSVILFSPSPSLPPIFQSFLRPRNRTPSSFPLLFSPPLKLSSEPSTLSFPHYPPFLLFCPFWFRSLFSLGSLPRLLSLGRGRAYSESVQPASWVSFGPSTLGDPKTPDGDRSHLRTGPGWDTSRPGRETKGLPL